MLWNSVSRHFLLGQKLFDTCYLDIGYYAILLPRQCLLDISSFWQRLLWHLGLDFQNPSLWPLLLGLCYLSLLLSGYYPLIQIATETFATLKTMWHLLLRQKLLLMVMTSSDCSKDKVLPIASTLNLDQDWQQHNPCWCQEHSRKQTRVRSKHST